MSALEELRRLEQGATEGPWEARIGAYSSEACDYSGGYIPEVCEEGHDEDGYYATLTEADAEFIAAARNQLPRLLDALNAVTALHHKIDDLSDDARWSAYCDADGHDYPCPTVAAITDALGDTQ